MVRNIPAAEVDVTVDLIRALLRDQHPDLADRELARFANGWDNAIFRLGDDLNVRAPRRQAAAELVLHERRWLPQLATRLPIPIPSPVRVGHPGHGYPWAWSVTPWFAGEVAADVSLADPAGEAVRLGQFLAALHQPAPSDAPTNPFRATPIAALDERVMANLAALAESPARRELVDVEACHGRWNRLVGTPPWEGPPLWVHGDLHTANLLVAGGSIGAVIDFGDITSGDPAVDLAVAWMLFGPEDRARFRLAAGDIDELTWRRGEAWALHFALLYLLHSGDSTRFERMGRSLLAALLDSSG